MRKKADGSNKSPIDSNSTTTVWQIMAMDFIGSLTESGPDKHEYNLVMCKYLTRYVTVTYLPDKTT